jgi:putative thioredoxin
MDHEEAGTALASLLLSQGRNPEALDVLAPLSPSGEVEKLRATARLISSEDHDLSALTSAVDSDSEDSQARLDLGQALAAQAEFEPALDHFLAVVRMKNSDLEKARAAMVDVFEVLGSGHPLAQTYRRELANALN